MTGRKDTNSASRAVQIARGSAPGKAILCGEHAVVYGQPAIALPITALTATAMVRSADKPGIRIRLPDINQRLFGYRATTHPLMILARRTTEMVGVRSPSLHIKLNSTIAIASGMGSGAALGAALVRGIASFYEQPLDDATISGLVYESERYFHGTPSGIDNTVVSYGLPIWYRRDGAGGPPHIEPLWIGATFDFVIADTGVRAPTRVTVAGVRERWTADPQTYDNYFTRVGDLTHVVRAALVAGSHADLGHLLNENQALLDQIGVSSPELNRLTQAARAAGALGAKLSGGGGGGIMLAVVHPRDVQTVSDALLAAGATRVVHTKLHPTNDQRPATSD